MRRWTILALIAALALGCAPAAVDAMPRVAKKHACKAAKKKRHGKRKHKHCKKPRRATKPPAPGAAAPAAPATPAPPAPAPAPAPTDPGGPTLPDDPADNPRALQVTSGEYFLNLSKHQVLSGDVRVEFNNAFAEDPHDLHLVREDGTGDSYAFGQLEAGEVEAKTLDLNAGRWTLFCALPEHAGWGMKATLRVSG
jgi:plastocyanin